MITAERFAEIYWTLCPHLRWKTQFYTETLAAPAPPPDDGFFWCAFTQTCVGPDGALVEPEACASSRRACYETGQVR